MWGAPDLRLSSVERILIRANDNHQRRPVMIYPVHGQPILLHASLENENVYVNAEYACELFVVNRQQ